MAFFSFFRKFPERILINEARTVTFAAGILAVSALTSAAIGILRDRLLASRFGAGDVLDIYFAAFRIPDFLLQVLVLGVISATFVPIFSELFEKDNASGWRFAGNLLTLAALFLFLLALVLFLIAPLVVPLVAPGFLPDKLDRTIFVSRMFTISIMALGISGIFSGILHYFRRFLLYAFAPVFYNLGIIFGILFLSQAYQERGVALGVILGSLLHLGIQIPGALRAGFRPLSKPFPLNPAIARMIALSLPRMFNIAFNQLTLLVINAFGSVFAAGSIAIWNLAENIQAVPISVIGASFALATFPLLAKASAKNDPDLFSKEFLQSFGSILFWVIPASMIIFLLRAQLVRVILGAGLFGWEATQLTAAVLGIFAFFIPAQALLPLLVRGFFALKDTITPLAMSFVLLLATAVSVALFSFLFSQPQIADLVRSFYRLEGIEDLRALSLPLGFGLATFVQIILLILILSLKTTISKPKLGWILLRIILLTIPAAVAVRIFLLMLGSWFDLDTFWEVLIQGGVSGLAGILVYLSLAKIFRAPELAEIAKAFRAQYSRD